MDDFSACANAEPVSRLEQLERENADFRTWGIIEIATRNPNVAEYMTYWEARAEKAEAENEALRARLETVEADRAAQAERMAKHSAATLNTETLVKRALLDAQECLASTNDWFAACVAGERLPNKPEAMHGRVFYSLELVEVAARALPQEES